MAREDLTEVESFRIKPAETEDTTHKKKKKSKKITEVHGEKEPLRARGKATVAEAPLTMRRVYS